MSRKKLIIIAALIVALVLVIVIGFTKCNNDKANEVTVEDEVALDGDPDAWWKSYVQGERDASISNGTYISWSAVDGAESYNVYRSETKDGEYVLVANVKTTEYTDKTTDGKTYFYKTTAVKTVKQTVANGSTKVVTQEEKITEEITTQVVTAPVTQEVTTGVSEVTTSQTAGTTTASATTASTTATTTKATTKATTKPTTTTTTQKVIPSAPSVSTKSSKISNADAKFVANVKSASSTQNLATLCSKASGISAGVSKISVGGTITPLTNKKISGYDECYRFTKEVTVTNINAVIGSVRYAGYIFKLSDGVDPEEFANSLLDGTASRYSLTLQYFTINYKVVDYYDNYVFYMVSYD